MLDKFNFDIVIILIIIGAVISGCYRGIFRQLRSTLIIGIPIAIVCFMHETILKMLMEIAIVNTICSSAYKVFGFFTNFGEDVFKEFFVLLMVILIMVLVLSLILGLIKPSKYKSVVSEKSKANRAIGAAIGIIQAYFLIVFCLLLIKPITNFDTSTPITNIVITTNEPLQEVLDITLLN